jgi:two-component sensor histidine kinase
MSRHIADKLVLFFPFLLVLVAFAATTAATGTVAWPIGGVGGLIALGLAALALYNMRAMKLLQAANVGLNAELVERKLEDERVRALALERELLFKELQHRVKNSMSIITSLVGLEESRADTPKARAVLSKLESRVAALSYLYDILCDEGGIDSVELADYLGRVVDSAAEGLGADAKGISFDQNIEPGAIDIKRALSLGLIVNELVTDSLKYAFPEGRGGRVAVGLAREGSGFLLEVSDDGVGFPLGFDLAEGEGFGLGLVGLLAEQLGAEFSARNEGGARFQLRMPA